MDRQAVDLDPEGQVPAPDPLLDLLGRMRGAVVQDQVQNADLLAPEGSISAPPAASRRLIWTEVGEFFAMTA